MPPVLHTAGWVRITAVDGTMAVAVVSQRVTACSAATTWSPTSVPVAPVGGSPGEVDYTDAARILFTEEGGYTAGIHRFAVIDRGRNANITPGSASRSFVKSSANRGPVNNLWRSVRRRRGRADRHGAHLWDA